MATIRDLSALAVSGTSNRPGQRKIPQPPTTWRDELLPAHFDGRLFHVESGSREGGRRIVSHEFPKKEIGYAEDMGRKATAFMVRGYIIVYPHDEAGASNLYRRDYRIARDALQERLDQGEPGVLQLPTFKSPLLVRCQNYRLTEEERFGGFCVFDMQFIERGVQPFHPRQSAQQNLTSQAEALKAQISATWAQQRARAGFEKRRYQLRGSRG